MPKHVPNDSDDGTQGIRYHIIINTLQNTVSYNSFKSTLVSRLND